MEETFLYKGKKPIQWTFSQVLDLCKLAIEQGAAEELAAEADAQGIKVTVPGDAINFTKRFIVKKRLHKTSDGLKGIVQSALCTSVVKQPDYNVYKNIPKDKPDGGNPDGGV